MRVLVSIVRKRLNLDVSMHALLQIFSVTLFKKMPLQQVFEENSDGNASCQLNLFEI